MENSHCTETVSTLALHLNVHYRSIPVSCNTHTHTHETYSRYISSKKFHHRILLLEFSHSSHGTISHVSQHAIGSSSGRRQMQNISVVTSLTTLLFSSWPVKVAPGKHTTSFLLKQDIRCLRIFS